MEFEKAKIVMAEQRVKEILTKLEEPFDPADLYYKPQAVNKAKDMAIAAAYCDPRAYSDRLNTIVGADKWSVSYQISTLAPIAGPNPEDWKNKFIYKGKVLVVATLTIEGLGQHSNTGEEEATNDNAITSASAQAFKRAATMFGLGRYLYDLPKNVWSPYDDKSRRITEPPALPDWAIPKKACEDCKVIIAPYQHTDRVISVTELIANSQRKYAKQLCAVCQQTRAKSPKVETDRSV